MVPTMIRQGSDPRRTQPQHSSPVTSASGEARWPEDGKNEEGGQDEEQYLVVDVRRYEPQHQENNPAHEIGESLEPAIFKHQNTPSDPHPRNNDAVVLRSVGARD
jgi:hypothetical protein